MKRLPGMRCTTRPGGLEAVVVPVATGAVGEGPACPSKSLQGWRRGDSPRSVSIGAAYRQAVQTLKAKEPLLWPRGVSAPPEARVNLAARGGTRPSLAQLLPSLSTASSVPVAGGASLGNTRGRSPLTYLLSDWRKVTTARCALASELRAPGFIQVAK